MPFYALPPRHVRSRLDDLGVEGDAHGEPAGDAALDVNRVIAGGQRLEQRPETIRHPHIDTCRGIEFEVREVEDVVLRQREREPAGLRAAPDRSEEHTSELQSPCNLVCRLLLDKKKI